MNCGIVHCLNLSCLDRRTICNMHRLASNSAAGMRQYNACIRYSIATELGEYLWAQHLAIWESYAFVEQNVVRVSQQLQGVSALERCTSDGRLIFSERGRFRYPLAGNSLDQFETFITTDASDYAHETSRQRLTKLVAITLRGFIYSIWWSCSFCVLSFSLTFLISSTGPTGVTGRPILMFDGWNDAIGQINVPSGSCNDNKFHLGSLLPLEISIGLVGSQKTRERVRAYLNEESKH